MGRVLAPQQLEATMKSFLHAGGGAVALFVAFTGQACAVVDLPEPGSIALVGVGLGAALYFLRKGRK